MVAADDLRCLLFALDRLEAAAARLIVALADRAFLDGRLAVVVDGAAVSHQINPRPIIAQVILLAHEADKARPGIRDAAQGLGAQRFGRRLQNGPGILGRRGSRCQRHQNSQNKQLSRHHVPLLLSRSVGMIIYRNASEIQPFLEGRVAQDVVS